MKFERTSLDAPAQGGTPSPAALERENKYLKMRIAELERLVGSDALTPLFNRHHFTKELDRWCWRAHRYGGQCGLVIIDVDQPKDGSADDKHLVSDLLLSKLPKP